MSKPSHPQGAGAPNNPVQEEDPLVELARIVSGGNSFEDAMSSQPNMDMSAPNRLEAELMNELQFDDVAQAGAVQYSDDAYSDPAYQNAAYPEDADQNYYQESHETGMMHDPNYAAAHGEHYSNQGYTNDGYSGQAYEQSNNQMDAQLDFNAAFQSELDSSFRGAQPSQPISNQPVTSPQPDMGALPPQQYDVNNGTTENVAPFVPQQIEPVGVAPQTATQEVESQGSGKFVFAAALVVLLLLVGVGVYAFNTGSGDIINQQANLIEADSDPVKVKPDDPGGVSIPNQDKAVYERVGNEESQGASTPQQEKLVVGTEEPNVVLDATSKSEDRLDATSNQESIGGNSILAPRRVQTVVVKPDGTILPSESTQNIASLNNQNGEADIDSNNLISETDNATVPVDQQVAALQPIQPATTQPEVPNIATFDGGRSASGVVALPKAAPAGLQVNEPRPVVAARPSPPAVAIAPQPTNNNTNSANQPLQLNTPRQQTQSVATAPPPAQASSSASASGGGFVVQVSSQRSVDAARASYANIQRRYGSILGGRTADIQRAEIQGKGTFYRVRVPAGSRGNAISLCEALKNAGGACFVTR